MTLAKKVLLGSAAALVATTGAQAADLGLPVAPAVDYVQICSVAGMTGFILPGSDVCFDISGFARFQAVMDADVDSGDEISLYGVGELDFDARTMTEYGLLRGFLRIGATSGGNGGGAGTVTLAKAFVQVGGLTAGFTDSFFDMVYTDYALGNVAAPTGGSADLGLIGYAYAVGNGVTLMASLEDPETRDRDAATALLTDFDYDADNSMPDVVLAVRVDQAWGSAKLSGAIAEVDAEDVIPGGAVDNEIGFAIGASAEFNLPVGIDSNFGIFGIYSEGALGYAGIPATSTVGATTIALEDAIMNGTSIELTEAFALGAGFEFGLMAGLDLEVDGYYAEADPFGNNNSVSWMGVRGSLAYVPVTGLELRGGIGYTSVDADGTIIAAGTDDDEIGATFRITRSF